MQKYIRHLKQKPDHVRRRIAVGASAGITALVAVIWVTAMSASGTFALGTGNGDANAARPSTDAFALDGTNVKSNFSQLAGAVNAVTGAATTEPALTIIDGTTTSSIGQPPQPSDQNNTSATVLSF